MKNQALRSDLNAISQQCAQMEGDVAHALMFGPVGREDRWNYRVYTFPALRVLLDRVGDCDDVIAIGVNDGQAQKVGLALGRIATDANGMRYADLHSVYVKPELRQRSIGAGLLGAFSAACQLRGLAEIRATYMTGTSSTTAVQALLAAGGWSTPETRMLVIEATLASIQSAPWIKSYSLAAGMEIIRWVDLSCNDRDAIAQSQCISPWIPPDLYPFDHEANCEPITSLALRLDGRIVGWVINHRVGNVLRFTCSFMHRRLQRMGRILLLYNESVARAPQAGLDTGMWTVPVWHPEMAAFAKRWMAPYATRFVETRGTHKVLL